MSSSDVSAFIEKLKESAFRERLKPSLIQVKEGDWKAVVQIAKDAGFHFTVSELKAGTPGGFFRGSGKYQDLGWHPSTRSK